MDAIDNLKYEHYETVAEHTRQVWRSVVKRAAVAARGQVDIFEQVSEKGVQCDCLGILIAAAGDPFDMRELDVIRSVVGQGVEATLYTSLFWFVKLIFRSDGVNGMNGNEGDGEDEHVETGPSVGTAPTAPSPPLRQTDPFGVIDEVPSVKSPSDEQPLSPDTSKVRSLAEAMTPPLTPDVSRTHPEVVNGGAKYLTILGGYGWRG